MDLDYELWVRRLNRELTARFPGVAERKPWIGFRVGYCYDDGLSVEETADLIAAELELAPW